MFALVFIFKREQNVFLKKQTIVLIMCSSNVVIIQLGHILSRNESAAAASENRDKGNRAKDYLVLREGRRVFLWWLLIVPASSRSLPLHPSDEALGRVTQLLQTRCAFYTCEMSVFCITCMLSAIHT